MRLGPNNFHNFESNYILCRIGMARLLVFCLSETSKHDIKLFFKRVHLSVRIAFHMFLSKPTSIQDD
jgi:hypothetical protein